MFRSFSDRLLGGVCGGMAAVLPLNAWLIRIVFVVLTGVTLGAFALLYLMLWLIIPQESVVTRRDGGAFWMFVTLVLVALVVGAWVAQLNGLTRLSESDDLYYPLLLLLLSAVFFFRQFKNDG